MNRLLVREMDQKDALLRETACLQRPIWVTWENQRRTRELAKALNTPLYTLISKRNYLLRVLYLSIQTILLLVRIRPQTLIVQNPSIALTTLACALQRMFQYVLVVDRHSNFRIEKAPYRSIKEKLFQVLSRYTIRKAHLTIVTNEFLKNLLEKWGGRGFVLQDKLPTLDLAERIEMEGGHNVVFISSYSGDEPISEVIEAARLLDPSTFIYLTGDHKKLPREVIINAPENVRFTGFLNEKMYQSLLFSSDAVMALTTADHFLLCGAYEAVSLGKPLILSRKDDLRDYFCYGVIFSENDGKSLAASIESALKQKERLEREAQDLRVALKTEWKKRFKELLQRLYVLNGRRADAHMDLVAYKSDAEL